MQQNAIHKSKFFFQEAVEYLCCGSEDLRGRLRSLDPELFQFKASDIPDIEGLSMQLKELNELANSISEKHNEGSLAATFSSAQKGKLERIAKIIYSMDIALAKHA